MPLISNDIDIPPNVEGKLYRAYDAKYPLDPNELSHLSYGCATTDSLLVQGTMSYNTNIIGNYSIRNSTKPPGVRQQIIDYFNSTISKTIDLDRTLYVIWTGINNYYYDTTITPLQTVEIIINQPPFDRFPTYRAETTTATKVLYQMNNQILAQKFNQTYFLSPTRLNLLYGFENLDGCWDTESSSTVIIKCQNITRRLFSDETHPTSPLYMLIVKEFYLILGGSN